MAPGVDGKEAKHEKAHPSPISTSDRLEKIPRSNFDFRYLQSPAAGQGIPSPASRHRTAHSFMDGPAERSAHRNDAGFIHRRSIGTFAHVVRLMVIFHVSRRDMNDGPYVCRA